MWVANQNWCFWFTPFYIVLCLHCILSKISPLWQLVPTHFDLQLLAHYKKEENRKRGGELIFGVLSVLLVCGICVMVVISPFSLNSHLTFGSHSSSQYLLASTTTHLLVWNMLTCTSKQNFHIILLLPSLLIGLFFICGSSAMVYQSISQSPCLRSLQLCSSSICHIRLQEF